jgi:hypothetical protein
LIGDGFQHAALSIGIEFWVPHLERQEDTELEFLLFIPFVGLVYFVVFGFTGGFAGAIHARDREDRSLIANAGIGLVGWTVAAVVWRLVTGEWPSEFTLGLGLLALVFSIVFVHLLAMGRSANLNKSAQS